MPADFGGTAPLDVYDDKHFCIVRLLGDLHGTVGDGLHLGAGRMLAALEDFASPVFAMSTRSS